MPKELYLRQAKNMLACGLCKYIRYRESCWYWSLNVDRTFNQYKYNVFDELIEYNTFVGLVAPCWNPVNELPMKPSRF